VNLTKAGVDLSLEAGVDLSEARVDQTEVGLDLTEAGVALTSEVDVDLTSESEVAVEKAS